MKVLETLVDDKSFKRMIDRLAHEIMEHNSETEKLALVGLRTRGEFVARRIQNVIQEKEQVEIPFGILDVTLYRDDVRQHLRQPEVKMTDLLFDITGKDIILVDDVLFTGRTARSALNALMDFGRPRTIQFAVLIDRGHRELPIRADFVGKTVPTSRGQEVRVHLTEVDDHNGIDLIQL